LLQTLPAREEQVDALLERQARRLGQLHAEYLRRYEKPLDLHALMSPWGGRPDIGQSRSYRDGVPLIVVTFEDDELCDERLKRLSVRSMNRDAFSLRSGSVYLSADDAGAVDWLDYMLAAGARQLEFWFARQRNDWRKPRPDRHFFRIGFPLFLGAADEAPSGALRFHGRSQLALVDMKTQAERMETRGGHYRLFPLERLVAFTGLWEASLWAASSWNLDRATTDVMFQSQAWALVYFLHNAEKGAYRAKLDAFHYMVLNEEVGGSHGTAAFREAFRIRDQEDWQALEAAFHAYVRNTLLPMKLK
jgi:hypothetical protein